MTEHERGSKRIVATHADAPAENLFFSQYRHWMAGHSSKEVGYWDCAWKVLLGSMTGEDAKVIFAEFNYFTRVLCSEIKRPVRFRPDVCRCLCRDEYLVLKLVAASQSGDRISETSAVAELLGADASLPLLAASRSLAHALSRRGYVLTPIVGQISNVSPADRFDADLPISGEHTLH